MVQYLQLLLVELIRKKRYQIIQTFSFNQEASKQELFIKEFENKNTCILICKDVAGMGVNIKDVLCKIQ